MYVDMRVFIYVYIHVFIYVLLSHTHAHSLSIYLSLLFSLSLFFLSLSLSYTRTHIHAHAHIKRQKRTSELIFIDSQIVARRKFDASESVHVDAQCLGIQLVAFLSFLYFSCARP